MAAPRLRCFEAADPSRVKGPTALYRDMQNMVDYTQLPSEELFMARNVLRSETRGLELAAGPFVLGAHGLWKDRRERFLPWRRARTPHLHPAGMEREARPSLEVRNLFDTEHAEVFDAPMPGRWWIVGVQLGR